MITYEHSESDDSVTVDIVLLVAEETGDDPAELPPIEESIDPDALDALFSSALTEGSQRGYVEFTYHGYQVTVPLDGDQTITITEESAYRPEDSRSAA